VRLGVGGRIYRIQIQGDAQGAAGILVPHRLDGQTVPEHEVVRRGERGRRLGTSRSVVAVGVAEEGRAPRLVQGGPVADAVTQPVVYRCRVVGEPLGGVAHRPAAGVL